MILNAFKTIYSRYLFLIKEDVINVHKQNDSNREEIDFIFIY